MKQLDNLLGFLEENIDLEHIGRVEKQHVDAVTYKEVSCLPLSVMYPLDGEFIPYSYREAFDDPEKMLYNELLWSFSSIYNSVKLKDYFPLQIRSNHGVGIIASMFGANFRIVNDNMPWVDHFENMEDIRRLIGKGIPEYTAGLGARVIQTHKYYIDRLKEYSKCFKAIHITQPDLQGPFDIAHLLLGSRIFFEVYDNPEILHELLELITHTYIGFRKHMDSLLTDDAGENLVYVHGAIYGGKVIIKDDTAAVNLSGEMYREFSKQYNDMIFKEFNGGTLHHCGQGRNWHFESMNCPWLKGMNYGNPEMHDLGHLYSYWSSYKIPIIWWGYNQKSEFLNQVYKFVIPTGVTLATNANSFKEAVEILKKHMQR